MDELIIYSLAHSYEVDEKYKASKLIGFFSSKDEINSVIEHYITLPGFRDYPRSCFEIEKHLINDYSKWINGFDENQLELLY